MQDLLEGSALLQSKYWHGDLGVELMSELLGETAAAAAAAAPPIHRERGEEQEEEGPWGRRESMVNKLISTVYSGPTISDIESALSFTGGDQAVAVDALKYNSSPVVFSPEKVLSKMENKYTLKIKTGGNNGLAEDGYKWRKYGQKSIKNSPNPRSYYRCTNPRCNAKKQVERATDEPDTLVVTYEGLHLHYTYSHFLSSSSSSSHHQQQQQQQGPPLLSSLPKKPKLHPRGGAPISSDAHHGTATPLIAAAAHDHEVIATSPLDAAAAAAMVAGGSPPAAVAADSCGDHADSTTCYFDDDEGFMFHAAAAAAGMMPHSAKQDDDQQMVRANGLLEDVVPLLVRRPACSSTTSGSSPAASSPSPSTSSSVSWTPTSPYIDMAILSNIF
ncbi:hypothetical protein ACP4OV_020020 [Aristida adscensionis]